MTAALVLCWLLAAFAPRLSLTDISAAGNATERINLCQDYQLPVQYEQYLNTTFLGERMSAQVGTVDFSYYNFGPLQDVPVPGRPLVLIAGQGATSSIWGPDLLSSLAQTRPVVIFDTRGIGLSTDSSTDSYTIGLFAESTIGLIDALELDQPDVLGWSQGGFVGLLLAANYSTAINRLVLTDTGLGGLAFAETEAGAEQNEALSYLLPIAESGSPLPPTVIYPDEDAGNEALCRLLLFMDAMPANNPTQAQTLRAAPAILDYISNTSSDGDLIYDSLSEFTTPVLLIAGRQDLVLPVQADLAILDMVPGAVLVEYPDAGHAAILQHSLTNAAIITNFLDGQPVPPDSSTYNVVTAS